jgi:glycosyltransferase involved in cell wall biosynthesis
MSAISIALTTFNGAEFLEQQLESLRAQTRAPLELQIGDDGSTDATETIVERFRRSAAFPVHFVRNEASLGYGENFIRTALRCSGDWIAFCDQDDVWDAGKLEWAENHIADGPCDLMLLTHNATIVDPSLRGGRRLYNHSGGDSTTSRLELPPEWYSIGFTQVFRADLVRSIPSAQRVKFPWHRHQNAHDVWIALLANCTGSVLRSGRSLALYRRHHSTVTDQGIASTRPPFERTGSGYADRAAYLEDAATTLRGCAPGAKAELGRMLLDAADRIERQAAILGTRARAYQDQKLGDRVDRIFELYREGAYLGNSPWRFGGARLIKDVACALRIL